MLDETSTTSTQALLQLSAGFIPARAVYVAAKLCIADLLVEGPMDARDLADRVGADPDALFRVLRLLAAVGVLKQCQSGRFTLTELGHALRRDSPESIRDYVLLWHESFYPIYTNIMHRMCGGSAQLSTFGKSAFEMVRSDPGFAEIFYNGLANRARIDIAALMDALDFSQTRVVADIGGGNGGLLFAILSRYERLSGILFDIPPAIALAEANAALLSHRCEFIVGDFFKAVPAGADLYLLKLVLHDWGDDDALRILARCRDAMMPDSRLLVIEGLIGAPNALTQTMLTDLNMMLGADTGRERTEAEFATLFERTGFKLRRTIATRSALYILEAVPV